MALFYPSLEQIDRLRVTPQEGEFHLLEFLDQNLTDDYEVFFQPFLNGDRPDIIIMRKNSGVMIIEVKDWDLGAYRIDQGGNWYERSNGARIKSPMKRVKEYKDNLFNWHIPDLLEKKIRNENLYAIISCVVYFHNADQNRLEHYFPISSQSERVKLIGRDSLTNENFQKILYNAYLTRRSYYFDEELYKSFRRLLKPPTDIGEVKSIRYSPR